MTEAGKLSISRLKTTHGDTKQTSKYRRLYRIWSGMKNRCFNERTPKYKNYGARGIKVCDEWKNSYETFKEWAINNGYDDDLTIERVDVNSDYCPENCTWIAPSVQHNNKTINVTLTYNGETKTLAQWSEDTGIPYAAIYRRYQNKWPVEMLLNPDHNKLTEEEFGLGYKGVTKNAEEWSMELGIPKDVIMDRIFVKNWPIVDAFEIPVGEDRPARKRMYYECNGEKHSIHEWSIITGIPGRTIRGRLREQHLSLEVALGFTPYPEHKRKLKRTE